MPVVVSLLRGVNVGGHQKIRMEDLRKVYESIGLNEPRTYIQSGNVVFRIHARGVTHLAKKIEAAIKSNFGFAAGVVVRTREEMQELLNRNPFADRQGIDPARLLVLFLESDPSDEIRARVSTLKGDGEELQFSGRELFIYFPKGMGKTKLPMAALAKVLAMTSTGRNWNTVVKLAEMAEELESHP